MKTIASGLLLLVLLLVIGPSFSTTVVADSAPKSVSPRRPAETDRRLHRLRRWWGRAPLAAQPNQVGKNHELVRDAFGESVKPANQFTVRILSGGRQIALGAIVDEGGFIVTKASELGEQLTCKIAGRGETPARLVASNEAMDLALLKVAATSLTPIEFAPTPTPVLLGSWVAVPGGFGDKPLVVGVVSGESRRIQRDAAALGVLIEDAQEGVTVSRVLPGSGAETAGVLDGDIITHVNGVVIQHQLQLVREVQHRDPGEKIELKLRRGKDLVSLSPILGLAREIAYADHGGTAHQGGAVSERQSGFPRAIQHDCLIQPYQCGGPLVNVDGQVIGINIARAGRVVSFALPSDVVAPAVQGMVATAKAARP